MLKRPAAPSQAKPTRSGGGRLRVANTLTTAKPVGGRGKGFLGLGVCL
jgi:hypothetical protein